MHTQRLGMLVTLFLALGAAPLAAQTFRVPVEYFTLPNGLKVVVSEDHAAPVALVEVMYNIGFRVEPKGRTGFAHLFEHMMFQGSAQVKKMEHVSFMQEAGGVVNGSTRFDYTNYFQALPSNALEMALWLEADRMRSLDVSADNLKNQQNVVSEEVRVNVLNQPHGGFEWLEDLESGGLPRFGRANLLAAFALFDNDPGRINTILAELDKVTVEDVKAATARWLVPPNRTSIDSRPASMPSAPKGGPR